MHLTKVHHYPEIIGGALAVACLITVGLGVFIARRRHHQSNKSNSACCGSRMLVAAGSEWWSVESEFTSPSSVAGSGSPVVQCTQPDLCISQSTPDLIRTPGGSDGLPVVDDKSSSAGGRCKQPVVKQQTLPAVSSRHLWFHRLLSGRSQPPAPSSIPPRDDVTDRIRREQYHGDQQQQQQWQHRHSATAAIVPMQGLRDLAVQTGFVQPAANQQGAGMSAHRIDGVATMPSVGGKSKHAPDSSGSLNNNHTSVTSVARAPAGASVTQSYGQLHVGLSYERDAEVAGGLGECSGTLVVNVIRIEGLPAREFSGSSDPYVKIHLLPDRTARYQTKLQRKTLNPVYDERFAFRVGSPESLLPRLLHFSIYDFDRFSRHDLIGTAVMQPRLHTLDVATERLYVLDIAGRLQSEADLGELLLSLKYLPTAGRLTVTILKARNLRATDVSGKSDPFVKVELMCQDRRITKRKTSVKRSTFCPVYNETMTFDVPHENIDDVSLVVKVVHHDSRSGSELMGACAVGSRFSDVGRDHWFKMLELPRKSVAQWYRLGEHVPSANPTASCGDATCGRVFPAGGGNRRLSAVK